MSKTLSLFDDPPPAQRTPAGLDASLDQYFTPLWAAQLIVDRFFGDLDENDVVIDPCSGDGALLRGLPAHVPAIGIEIDPKIAARARELTGRTIITGDFRTVPIDLRPTALLANPPFNTDIIDGFLDRAHQLLPHGGRAGFILPAYVLQTPSRVLAYNERWSLRQEFLPRTLFPNLSKPLCFCLFSKDRQRLMVGFALYREAAAVADMPDAYREKLGSGAGSIWVNAVREALRNLGGEASIAQIYQEMEPRRPSQTQFWKEKIRQVLREHFDRVGPALYSDRPLPRAA